MFVLTTTPMFWWPVVAEAPGPVPGEIVRSDFEMLFEAMPLERSKLFLEQIGGTTTTVEMIDLEIDQIRAVARDWRGVVDDAGDRITFTADALDGACRWPWFRRAVMQAYVAAIAGEAAKRGN